MCSFSTERLLFFATEDCFKNDLGKAFGRELEAHFLRHDHVEHKDRVLVILQMLGDRVQMFDACKINALSPSFANVVDLLTVVCGQDVLREERRSDCFSRVCLNRSEVQRLFLCVLGMILRVPRAVFYYMLSFWIPTYILPFLCRFSLIDETSTSQKVFQRLWEHA